MENILEIAIEQLERVKRGEMPTEEGKKLIGKISYFKSILEKWRLNVNTIKLYSMPHLFRGGNIYPVTLYFR